MTITTVALSDTVDQWRTRTNELISVSNAQVSSTTLASLTTSAKSTLVAAVNELNSLKANLSGATFSGALTCQQNVSFSTKILLANGTAGAPSVTFTNDTDAGLYWASNTVYIGVGGEAIVEVANTSVTINKNLTLGSSVTDINLPDGCEINLAGNFAIRDSGTNVIIDQDGVGAGKCPATAITDYTLTYQKLNGRQAADQLNVSGTVTLNYNNGDWHRVKTNGSATIALSNFPSGKVAGIILQAENFGAYTITWPVGIKWGGGGTAPTLTSSGVDLISLMYESNGTLYGSVIATDCQ